jgi:hypothetical protein
VFEGIDRLGRGHIQAQPNAAIETKRVTYHKAALTRCCAVASAHLLRRTACFRRQSRTYRDANLAPGAGDRRTGERRTEAEPVELENRTCGRLGGTTQMVRLPQQSGPEVARNPFQGPGMSRYDAVS